MAGERDDAAAGGMARQWDDAAEGGTMWWQDDAAEGGTMWWQDDAAKGETVQGRDGDAAEAPAWADHPGLPTPPPPWTAQPWKRPLRRSSSGAWG